MNKAQHARRLLARLDQRLWQPVPTAHLVPFLVHTQTQFPFRHVLPALDDAALNRSFAYYNNAPQHAYVYHVCRTTLVEPVRGYAVWGTRGILPESMPYWYHVGYPSFVQHLVQRATRPTQRERAVVSLHEFGDDNYYHFYGDVLGKLALLEEHGVGTDLPVVVSARLARKAYFQAAVARSPKLRARRWIVQARQHIVADEVIFCKTLPHAKPTFDWMADLLQTDPADPHADDRIFLTRSARRGRYIANSDQVAQVCSAYGFRLVDADQLTLHDQIQLFSRARYVVGIHGAGLTNMIFRRGAPLSVLELFPPDNLPPHYFWLAHAYGFGYDALVGTPSTTPGAFKVDLDLLHHKLRRLLTEDAAAIRSEQPHAVQ